MEIWDEGAGLKSIIPSGLGNGAFVHSTFKPNQTKTDGVVSAQMKYEIYLIFRKQNQNSLIFLKSSDMIATDKHTTRVYF